jgi:hypothetical protein
MIVIAVLPIRHPSRRHGSLRWLRLLIGVDRNDHGHPAWRRWQLHNSAIFSASVLDAIGLERMISAGSAVPEILQAGEEENSQPSASGQLLTSLLSQSEDISIRNRAPNRIPIFSRAVPHWRARV